MLVTVLASATLIALLPTAAAAQAPTTASATASFDIEPRIVGGSAVPDDRYEFTTYLAVGPFACVGTLVAPEWIMTAAHCLEDVAVEDITAAIGIRDLSNLSTGEIRDAIDMVVHPGWNIDTFENDLAFIKIAPVTSVPPVPIGVSAQQSLWAPGTLATVAGWGNTLTAADPVDVLRSVEVPVLSDAACLLQEVGPAVTPSLMICAGESGVDACQGDSGGPLFVDNPAGGHVVFGVVSWGLGCAEPNRPGVYTELTAFTPFIDSVLMPVTTELTTSCVGGNGVVLLTVDNPSQLPATITLSTPSLPSNTVTVPPGMEDAVWFSGRPDGPLLISVTGDAEYDQLVQIDCDPPAASSVECVDSNGLVAVTIENSSGVAQSYAVTLGSLPTRTIAAGPTLTVTTGFSGRPDGNLALTVFEGANELLAETVTVDCDPNVEAVVTVSCLSNNGLISTALTNVTAATADYEVTVGAIGPRARTLPAGESSTVNISGRPEGMIAVEVTRDGTVVHQETVEVDCDPNVEVDIVNSCLAGNGRLDVNVLNLNGADATYEVIFGTLAPRSALVATGDATAFPITGRPDGQITVAVSRDGTAILTQTLTVACDV